MTDRIASLDLKALIHEVASLLKGSFIRNIYQKNSSFLFKLWTKEGKKHLLIEPSRRLNITKVMETGKATELAKALRRHLRKRRITTISQYKLDRIFEMKVGREYKVIIELFPRGNLVVLKNDKIILAQKHQHMRDRNIYPGKNYEYPPGSPKNPLNMRKEEFISNLKRKKDLVRGLVTFFGPKYAEEICLRTGIDKNTNSDELKERHFSIILKEIEKIISDITGNIEPQVYYDEERIPIDFTPFPFKSLQKYEKKEFSSLSEAIEEFYIQKRKKKRKSKNVKRVERTKKKLLTRMKSQKKKISSFKENVETYRERAKKIYNHLREINLLIDRIRRAKKVKNFSWEKISQQVPKWDPEGMIEEIHRDGNIRIIVEETPITLNIMETPQERAERYFNKAKKIKERRSRAEQELEKTKRKLQKVEEEVRKEEEKEKITVQMPERHWFESFRWFTSSDDFLVLAGKNAKTNEKLIKSHMKKGDIFLHAEVHGGAATVIKGKGDEIPSTTIKEAAIFAGSFSNAWKEGFAGVDVYYTPAEKVTLSAPSGEYLPKGGFMTKEKNYLNNVGLKISTGVLLEEIGENAVTIREIGGPTSAITHKTKLFVTLLPGKIQKGRIAAQIKTQLKQMASRRLEEKAIEKLPKEKFLRFIPSHSRIRERK